MKTLFSQLFKRGVVLFLGLASAFCAQAMINKVSLVKYADNDGSKDKIILIFGEYHEGSFLKQNKNNIKKIINQQYEALESFFETLKKNNLPITLLIEFRKELQQELAKKKSDFKDYFDQFYGKLTFSESSSFTGEIINFDKTRSGINLFASVLEDLVKFYKQKKRCLKSNELTEWEEGCPEVASWNLCELEEFIKNNMSCATKIDSKICDHIASLKEHIGDDCYGGHYKTVLQFVNGEYFKHDNQEIYFDKFFDYVRKIERVVADIDLLKAIKNVDQGNIIIVHCGDYHRQAVVKYLENEHGTTAKTINGNPTELLDLLSIVNILRMSMLLQLKLLVEIHTTIQIIGY